MRKITGRAIRRQRLQNKTLTYTESILTGYWYSLGNKRVWSCITKTN